MTNTLNDQLWNHLEFLGYKLENLDADKGNVILATHGNKSNLGLNIVDDTIFISVRYDLGVDIPIGNLVVYLTKINSRTMFTKWYCEENDDKRFYLCVDTFIFGYEKQLFGYVLDALENEINQNVPLLKGFLDL